MGEYTIRHVSESDVRAMADTEGLILQGCGGDPREWMDRINKMLTDGGILKDGDTFRDVCVFNNGGHTNLLFPLGDVRLDIGKLAAWRITNFSTYWGAWLSDYRQNPPPVRAQAKQTGDGKPEMQLAGMDGNIFRILGNASRLLKQAGMVAQEKEMTERVTNAGSYDEALHIISEYVSTVLSPPEPDIGTEIDTRGFERLDNPEPKQVYICAPLRSDVERNIEAARLFAREVFERGDIPICPHLIFPPIADPKNPAEDAKALAMCMKLIEGCHQLNVYGEPTEGMKAEIAHARRMGITIHESTVAKKKTRSEPARGCSR